MVARIPSLAKLNVTDNPLAALPATLGATQSNLADVVANRCLLDSLPSGLAAAAGLRSLSCVGNRLGDVDGPLLAGPPLPLCPCRCFS